MPRKPLFRSSHLPYHVTNRANNREWFYIPLSRVWRICCAILAKSIARYGAELHSFVLMSNHYHLLLSTPRANLDLFMRYFQTEVCRRIQEEAGRTNHVFGTRYKWSVLPDPVSFSYAYKYVLRNPVRAGLTKAVQDYEFSSLKHILSRRSALPLIERCDSFGSAIPRALEERLSWLNVLSPREAEALVGKALRRTRFQFSRGNEIRLQLEHLKLHYGVEPAPATFSAEK